MSVVKFVNKNTPFQINSMHVGVEIRPDYVNDSIDFTYDYTNCTVVSAIDSKQIIVDHDKVPYIYNGQTQVVGETTYYALDCLDATAEHQVVYNQYEEPLMSQSLFIYDSETPAMTPVSTVGGVMSLSGNYIKVADNKVTADFATYYTINGQIIETEAQQPIPSGYISATNEVESEIEGATLQQTSAISGKYEFKKNSTKVWADSADPKVGDALIFSPKDITFNLQEVTASEDHEGAINSTLSYSVSAENWTSHATALTDRNNVICNCPRYMYLKLNQDCVITEA